MPISDKILLQHIEDLLQEYLPNDLRIEKTENQTRLTVGEPGIWIEYNEDFEEEILIGVEHRDCLHLGNQNDLVNTFFNLLTKRIRICRSFKGTFCFYETLDIELSDNRFYEFWSAGGFSFYFWKTTTTQIEFWEPYITNPAFERKILDLKIAMR